MPRSSNRIDDHLLLIALPAFEEHSVEQADAPMALLVAYLDAIERQLPLPILHRTRRTGMQTPIPPVQVIYTQLLSDTPPLLMHEYQGLSGKAALDLIDREQWHEQELDQIEVVRASGDCVRADLSQYQGASELFTLLRRLPAGELVTLRRFRAVSILADLAACSRLVLLGEPGAGKSTVLHLVLHLLKQRLTTLEHRPIPDWPDAFAPLPIHCPLTRVAVQLKQSSTPTQADKILRTALANILQGTHGERAGLDEQIWPYAQRGDILLLLDGLDEVPVEVRSLIAGAIQRLSMAYPQLRIVITCRTANYQIPAGWQMHPDSWATRTLQPLRYGQIRLFLTGWYRAAGNDPDQARWQADALADRLMRDPRTADMAQNPLTLTLLAQTLPESADGPLDHADLYERSVQTLLEIWPIFRNDPDTPQPGIVERVGLDPQTMQRRLRRMLNTLALEVHDQRATARPPGTITELFLRTRLTNVLRDHVGSPRRRAGELLAHLREEAGLLRMPQDEVYTFLHQHIEAYMAACALAEIPDPAGAAYPRWTNPAADHWRAAMLFFAGRLWHADQSHGPQHVRDWLRCLAAPTVDGHAKSPAQHRRDVVLAVGSLAQLPPSTLSGNDPIVPLLCNALHAVLETPDPAITCLERIQAAYMLGHLGDQRVPITMQAWQATCMQITSNVSAPAHYWRAIPAGAYQIGGWERTDASGIVLPHFWIARFPMTVAQYAALTDTPFEMDEWTPHGRFWRTRNPRLHPEHWHDARFKHPNQPVVGVSWFEAVAVTRRLTKQLAGYLPDGYVVRLPTEAEWEVAAAYMGNTRQPTPWGNAPASTHHAISAEVGRVAPAPIGCCPAGAAACGAQDLLGNVWEWTLSSYQRYPAAAHVPLDDVLQPERILDTDTAAVRGGDWATPATQLTYGLRRSSPPVPGQGSYGVRLVLAPA